jgi:hypothetical protein
LQNLTASRQHAAVALPGRRGQTFRRRNLFYGCANFAALGLRQKSFCVSSQVRLVGAFLCLGVAAGTAAARERESLNARVTVVTSRAECTVQLDADPPGKTDVQGNLVLREVDPTDHYVHVQCLNQPESGYFISPQAGQSLELRAETAAAAAQVSNPALDPAEAKSKRGELVRQAVQLRAQGRFDEAVRQLREAATLDPENSDLHRELGITFLLSKDWKRARVEMLEAIRHDPTDADAHNGLGYALEKLGEIASALKEYRAATHLDPDDPTYRQRYLEALAKEAGERQDRERKK